MPNGFLIVGSNDVGLQELELLREHGIGGAEAEMGYSGGTVQKLYDERFEIRVVPLDDIVCEVKSHALLSRLDGVCLMTCRPYGDGDELRKPLEEIRTLGDEYLAFPRVPARVVPVVLSDIKHAMARHATPPVSSPWVTHVPPAAGVDPRDVANSLATLGERGYDCLFRLVRNWRLDLMLDLEAGGLVIGRGPGGELRPRIALRRAMRGGTMHLSEFDPRDALGAGLPIFDIDLDVDREPFAAFAEMLDGAYRRYARQDRTKTEIALHRFLDQNPELLRSETYEDFLTETGFAIRNGTRSSIRPDLILRPVDCARTRFALVELKLPSHRVVVGRDESLRFSRGVLRAVEQVRTYRDRLLDPANAEEVARRTKGVVPEEYDLAVLIGMRRADEAPGTIAELRAAHDMADVGVIRYDELTEQSLKLCGRESPVLVP